MVLLVGMKLTKLKCNMKSEIDIIAKYIIDKGNEIGFVQNDKIMIYDSYKNVDKTYCKVLKKYNGVGGY